MFLKIHYLTRYSYTEGAIVKLRVRILTHVKLD